MGRSAVRSLGSAYRGGCFCVGLTDRASVYHQVIDPSLSMIPTPTVARLVQRMMPTRSYRDISARSWQLSPSSTRQEPPALFEPSDLPRILGVAETSTLALQMSRVRGGLRQHAPTMAYMVRNASLCNGHVVRPTMAHWVGGGSMPWFAGLSPPALETAVLASTAFGVKFFGHWLMDDMPLTLAARRLGEPISVLPCLSEHQHAYTTFLGTDATRVLDAQIKELVIIDDVGQNAFKAQRLEELRSRLLQRYPVVPSTKVMLLRKNTGKSRLLINEMEIADHLATQGFRILSPMETSAEELVRACLGAQVVVGVEGSHLTHALVCMPPGGTLLTLQPPQRFDAVIKDWCDCRQIRFGFVVGQPREEAGFVVSHDQLDHLLQQVA